MSKVYFISNQAVKDHTVLDSNVDEKILKVSITSAQETMLQPLLGTNLYERIERGILMGDLSQDYLKLLSNQIKKYLLAAVVYKIAINLLFRYTNSSIMKDSNSNSAGISTPELNAIRQEKESEIKFYANALTEYLTVNSSLFPEYYALRYGDTPPESIQSANNFYAGED